ncbi:DNA-binding GntR family transcriptional regulator [Rhizobium sp. BK313]|jgi:DNA-binding GntR family transcriptional regulator|uniref:FCD domain-containing protein n=1 Tax=Rhizobium sp. BK313 TaxID=2587081 RepID=UPI00105E78E6|nr:FCD domain-containing protein [Rhizobium sp. BK313]MBB3456305.1 DNA-binding GntR family transcriptional regulator [Rhizobium sp. BK313]
MTNELEFLKAHSLSSLVRRELEKLILSGEFAPGERLNEYVLAARFSVSRGPVREACRALAEKGLLDLVPNRGVFMRKIDEGHAAALYDVRAGLFASAVRLLASRITPEQLSALEDLLRRMDDAADRQSLDEYYPLNLEFHDSLMRFAGNSRLHSLYGELIKELHLFRERALLHDGGLAVSNAEHRRIVDALRARDAAAATEEAFNHVLSGKARMAIHDTHESK